MSEQIKKTRTKATGPRVFIVTIGETQYHVTANEFRVATPADTLGLLSGAIKALKHDAGTGFTQDNR